MTLEPDKYTAEKLVGQLPDQSVRPNFLNRYTLFENYQRIVHHEEPFQISERGFKRFLCSGLGQATIVEGGREKCLGSYHQCYRLDGRLIAMGVLDLLPDCVSSVYLMYAVLSFQPSSCLTHSRYHEDFSEWNFGKISALRETALALEGRYRYYYMGELCFLRQDKGFEAFAKVFNRILYPFVRQDALQRGFSANLCAWSVAARCLAYKILTLIVRSYNI